MIKKYYFYEVVRGDANEVVTSGIIWVWIFNSPSSALDKLKKHYSGRDTAISNMRRIK